MRTKLLFLSLSLKSVERQRPKKGARPWHYEAFTSDRLEIIRPVTSHNTKIMTVFTPTLSLPLFSPSPSHSSSSLTFFCFYCYHCQRGLRKLPEFLSSYLPPPLPSSSPEETTIALSKTIFTLVRSPKEDLFFRGVFHPFLFFLFPFFSFSFLFFFCSRRRGGFPSVSLSLLSRAGD